MSEKETFPPDLEALRARHLAEAAAEFDRKVAEARRLLEPLGLTIASSSGQPIPSPSKTSKAPAEIKKNEDRGFDGTFGGLLESYTTHPESPFQKLTYQSRETYGYVHRSIQRDFGPLRIEELTRERLRGILSDKYSEKKGMVGAVFGSVGRLATFGDVTHSDRACRELRLIVRDIAPTLPKLKKRDFVLTREMADKFRAEAHRRGFPSLALAQAIQFECDLLQRDVVGHWMPISEPGTSEVIWRGAKWLRGIRWSEIGDDLVLRRAEQKDISLHDKAMVRDELDKLGTLPRSGPVVVSEKTKRPYSITHFRQLWREIADAAGIPKDIGNRDSRARVEYDGPSRRRKIVGAAT
jgi:hypothetical protein